MGVLSMLAGLVLPKSSAQVEEERNTVSYPRVHGFPRKYVYGQRPEDPFAAFRDEPERKERAACERESDPAKIERHREICASEEGSHGGLCELCMRLNNPKRFELLVRLYRDDQPLEFAGLNVSDAVDGSKVNQSATSAYLRQLGNLGLIRRKRTGRLVNYTPDFSLAMPWVAEIARLMRERMRSGSADTGYVPIFRAMMGSLRSRVVRHIAAGGSGNIQRLRDQFNITNVSDLIRDMKPALDAKIIDLDSEDPDGTYTYITPTDPIARRIVELS